jgi:chromosome segregation ATPase
MNKILFFLLIILLTTACSNEKVTQQIAELKKENDSLALKLNEQEDVIISLFVKLNQIEKLVESNQNNNFKINQIKDLLNEKQDYKTQSQEIKNTIDNYFIVINSKEEQINILENNYSSTQDSLESIIEKNKTTLKVQEQKKDELNILYD